MKTRLQSIKYVIMIWMAREREVRKTVFCVTHRLKLKDGEETGFMILGSREKRILTYSKKKPSCFPNSSASQVPYLIMLCIIHGQIERIYDSRMSRISLVRAYSQPCRRDLLACVFRAHPRRLEINSNFSPSIFVE